MKADALFTPFAHGALRLANRIVMAPMTRSFSPGGVPGPDVADYYRRRAQADVGLIISEGTGVGRPAALHGPRLPQFHGETALAGWRKVRAAVHAAGGRIAPQLWHVGAARGMDPAWAPSAPYESASGLWSGDAAIGRTMSASDIADAVAAFAAAAVQARDLGFDALELHGAHGYLIDQFFWAATNRRDDAYGGPAIGDRLRFAADVVREVRRAVGPGFPMLMRLSQWKQQDYRARIASTPSEMEIWLRPLAEAGVDIFHCSQRRFWEPEFEGSDLNFAGWAKKLTGRPTITVGSVGLSGDIVAAYGGEVSQPAALDEVVRRLERGDFDLVAVGRALLQDPAWAKKVREDRRDALMPFDRSAMASLS